MASAEHEPNGSLGAEPQRGPEPLVRGSGCCGYSEMPRRRRVEQMDESTGSASDQGEGLDGELGRTGSPEVRAVDPSVRLMDVDNRTGAIDGVSTVTQTASGGDGAIIIDFPNTGITYNGGWCSATIPR